MLADMRTISVAVWPDDYEAFRRAAGEQGRSIAQLIREAMALYREEKIEGRTRLTEIPLLTGVRLREPLPTRSEVWDEMYGERWSEEE